MSWNHTFRRKDAYASERGKREGRQKIPETHGTREREERERRGYQNEISQANKYSVIANNRVIARYGAQRRSLPGADHQYTLELTPHVRRTRQPAYVSAYLTRHRVYPYVRVPASRTRCVCIYARHTTVSLDIYIHT